MWPSLQVSFFFAHRPGRIARACCPPQGRFRQSPFRDQKAPKLFLTPPFPSFNNNTFLVLVKSVSLFCHQRLHKNVIFFFFPFLVIDWEVLFYRDGDSGSSQFFSLPQVIEIPQISFPIGIEKRPPPWRTQSFLPYLSPYLAIFFLVVVILFRHELVVDLLTPKTPYLQGGQSLPNARAVPDPVPPS